MAVSEAYGDSASISTTEYSCPNKATYSSGSGIATDGAYQVWLDINAIAVGDQFQIRVYEKVISSGTQYQVYEAIITGPQAKTWVSPTLILLHAWDVTLKKLSGTDRTIAWSIRKA